MIYYKCIFDKIFILSWLWSSYIILLITEIKGTHTISKKIEIRPGTKER